MNMDFVWTSEHAQRIHLFLQSHCPWGVSMYWFWMQHFFSRCSMYLIGILHFLQKPSSIHFLTSSAKRSPVKLVRVLWGNVIFFVIRIAKWHCFVSPDAMGSMIECLKFDLLLGPMIDCFKKIKQTLTSLFKDSIIHYVWNHSIVFFLFSDHSLLDVH